MILFVLDEVLEKYPMKIIEAYFIQFESGKPLLHEIYHTPLKVF